MGESRIELDGACNFRDIGGLATRDGKVLRPGILFRSDDLSRLTDRDLEKLHQLKLLSKGNFPRLKQSSLITA